MRIPDLDPLILDVRGSAESSGQKVGIIQTAAPTAARAAADMYITAERRQAKDAQGQSSA